MRSGWPGPPTDRPHRGATRRTFLALAGLGVVSACTPSGEPSTTHAADLPVQLGTRWSVHPDGPLPAVGDEGTPIRPILAGSTVLPAVRDGALIGNLPVDHAAATYLTQRLGRRVVRLGARVGFGPGDDSGSVALVAWNGQTPYQGHCHMVFTPTRWIAGVLVDSAVVEVASDHYVRPAPQDGTPQRVDVQIRGATATLALPDGTARDVSDPRFAGAEGVVACWEFYKNDAGSAPTSFFETWAG